MRAALTRVAIVAGMALATVNIFTGAPLAGLLVGSRVVTDGQITMLAVLVIAVVMFAACSSRPAPPWISEAVADGGAARAAAGR